MSDDARVAIITSATAQTGLEDIEFAFEKMHRGDGLCSVDVRWGLLNQDPQNPQQYHSY